MAGGVTVGSLDLALTKIGWARTRQDSSPWAGTLRPRGRGAARLEDGFRGVVGAMKGCDIVVIEGYSFGSEYSGERLGEMGGVVRLGLWQMRPRPHVMEVPPKKLKKFATGNGNATKAMMLEHAQKRLGYGRSSDDEADALWLLQAALHYYGLPGAVPMPHDRVQIIRALDWPVLPLQEVEF